MKKQIFGFLTCALTSVPMPTLHADILQAPFLAPKYCPTSVSIPADASAYYRSEDCNTVFVLPPQYGTIETVYKNLTTDEDCELYDNQAAQIKEYNQHRASLLKQISKPGLSPSQLDILERQLTIVENSITRVSDSQYKLTGIAGAQLQSKLSSGLAAEVTRFQMANQQIFREGVNFVPAPIASSYVSILSPTAESARQRSAVIYSDIPGVEVRGITTPVGSATRILNGSASGMIQLGIHVVCTMKKEQGLTSVYQLRVTPKDLESYAVANLTYDIPVQTGYKSEAGLNLEGALHLVFNKIGNNPDNFTIMSIVNDFYEGQLNKEMTWKFDVLPMADMDSAKVNELSQQMREETFTRFASDLAEAMVNAGVLQKLQPIEIETPKPGTISKTYYERVCRTSKVLGFTVGHRCFDQPYQVVSVKAGSLNQVVNSVRNMNLSFYEKVEFREPIIRTHTSTFKYIVK